MVASIPQYHSTNHHSKRLSPSDSKGNQTRWDDILESKRDLRLAFPRRPYLDSQRSIAISGMRGWSKKPLVISRYCPLGYRSKHMSWEVRQDTSFFNDMILAGDYNSNITNKDFSKHFKGVLKTEVNPV